MADLVDCPECGVCLDCGDPTGQTRCWSCHGSGRDQVCTVCDCGGAHPGRITKQRAAAWLLQNEPTEDPRRSALSDTIDKFFRTQKAKKRFSGV